MKDDPANLRPSTRHPGSTSPRATAAQTGRSADRSGLARHGWRHRGLFAHLGTAMTYDDFVERCAALLLVRQANIAKFFGVTVPAVKKWSACNAVPLQVVRHLQTAEVVRPPSALRSMARYRGVEF